MRTRARLPITPTLGAALVALMLAGCAAVSTRPIPGGETVVAEAPTYRVGDEWTFTGVLSPLRVRVAAVEGESVITEFLGSDVTCSGCRYVRDRHLTVVQILGADGRPAPTPDMPTSLRRLDFPLLVGKTWAQTHRPNPLSSAEWEIQYRVEAFEAIMVAAGTFRAFRIAWTQRNRVSGWSGTATYWWSPDVRWFVRLEAFRDGGRDAELVRYSLK